MLAVISHLNEGNVEGAVALFADQFSFKDHGIRLELLKVAQGVDAKRAVSARAA